MSFSPTILYIVFVGFNKSSSQKKLTLACLRNSFLDVLGTVVTLFNVLEYGTLVVLV